ncbi:MAG: hypothetical protein ACT4N9_01385 [Paracoccaceae bacterium]
MTGELPEFYFRVRENGAAVFRVDTENRHRRIELQEIAVVNIRNGQIKRHGERALEAAEVQAIQDWIKARQATLAAREADDLHRTIDQLNLTAQWVQSRAEDDDLEAVTDALLMAMHDLRAVLVKRRADRATGKVAKDADPG